MSEAKDEHSTKVSAWAPLAMPPFRALWIAGLVSNFGALMHEVGEGWLMTSLSRSPLQVAALQAVDGVAMLLLALPAGTLADIVDRRRLSIGTQIWLFVFTAVMAVLAATGKMTPSLLLWLAFAMGVGSAVDEPIWQALTSDAVPRRLLPAAVTLGGVSVNLARALGPALGGLVVGAAGPAATFALNALTFLWVAVVLARSRRAPRTSTMPAERWVGGMFAGLRYVRHSPALVAGFVRCACVVGPASCLTALLPHYARVDLGLSSWAFGVLLGCMGIGALLAAGLLPEIRERAAPDVVLALAALVFGAALAVLCYSHSIVSAGAAMVVAGVGWMSMLSGLNVAVQTATEQWVQTRVLAVYLVVFQGALAAGSLVWGELAARAGTRPALLAGAITLVVLLIARVRFPLDARPGDFTLSVHYWPTPKLVCHPQDDDGPVLVTIEYRVPLEHASKFARALRGLERHRRRGGAIEWGFYRDTEAPARWLETYVTEDWGEHVRQHGRVTVDDRAAEDHVRSLIEPGTTPLVRHFISGDSVGTASATWRATSKSADPAPSST